MTKYTPDYAGIGEMLKSAEIQAHMRERAEKIAAAAEAIAPVSSGHDPEMEQEIAHYRDSFEVSSGVRHGETSRAYGRVENTSDHAAAIEYSNFRTRKATITAQHVLGRSIDAARD